MEVDDQYTRDIYTFIKDQNYVEAIRGTLLALFKNPPSPACHK